ncbi:hypothetical protein Trydic_g15211 [Trypoxylus dichotomus]
MLTVHAIEVEVLIGDMRRTLASAPLLFENVCIVYTALSRRCEFYEKTSLRERRNSPNTKIEWKAHHSALCSSVVQHQLCEPYWKYMINWLQLVL